MPGTSCAAALSAGAGAICVACVKATKEQQAANGAGGGATQPDAARGSIVKGGRVRSWGSLVGVAAAYFVMWDTVGLNRGHG